MRFKKAEDKKRANKNEVFTTFKRSLNEPISTNLKSLIGFLNLNNYYLNVVQYYNIEADVILFASIKEGRKMLKGVKYFMANESVFPHCNVENIKKIRSKLILLKMVFNQLFIELEKKQHLVVDKNHQTIKFLQLVDTVIDRLSAPLHPYLNSSRLMYRQIKTDLITLEDPTTDKILDIENDLIKNYFDLPLIHLYSLS